MPAFIALVHEQLTRGSSVALVTIATQAGSTPRTAGAKMLVTPEGLIAGTIGGGLLEARAIEQARIIAAQGGSQFLDMELDGATDNSADMICGGSVQIFISRVAADEKKTALFADLLERLDRGESAFLLTELSEVPGPEIRILPDDPCGEQNTGARRIFLDRREWLLEPYMAQSLLIIAGGGHISLPTSQIAASCGFSVTVLDDRAEFAAPARFPWARRALEKPGFTDCFADSPIREDSAIIIVTRGHAHDATVLEQALKTSAGYIGMIGSRRKRDAVYAAMLERGIDADQLARVHSPIGLSIGAETPAEIAVSIMAEIIAVRAGKECGGLRPPAPRAGA